MQRREVLAVWILLSAPIIGFVSYLGVALGLQFDHDRMPLFIAMVLAIVSLFFLSWTFLAHATTRDWRHCARFMAAAFIFEGIALMATRNSGGNGSMAFGVVTSLIGLALFVGAKKH